VAENRRLGRLDPRRTLTLSVPGKGEDGNATGDLDITSDVQLTGAGAAGTTIDAVHVDRVIDVQPTSTTTIQGLTITGGRPQDGSPAGNVFGSEGSVAGQAGGAAVGGNGGAGGDGGGIRNRGTLTIADCVVTANTAGTGGANGTAVGATGQRGRATGRAGPGATRSPGTAARGAQAAGSSAPMR
jgi:hypothetical protein